MAKSGETVASAEAFRTALLVLLVGGIGGVLWVLHTIGPAPLAAQPAQMGQTESRLREEAGLILGGPEVGSCQYYAKILVLMCPVPRASTAGILDSLKRRGWESRGGEAELVRGKDSASVSCASAGCELNFRYRLRS